MAHRPRDYFFRIIPFFRLPSVFYPHLTPFAANPARTNESRPRQFTRRAGVHVGRNIADFGNGCGRQNPHRNRVVGGCRLGTICISYFVVDPGGAFSRLEKSAPKTGSPPRHSRTRFAGRMHHAGDGILFRRHSRQSNSRCDCGIFCRTGFCYVSGGGIFGRKTPRPPHCRRNRFVCGRPCRFATGRRTLRTDNFIRIACRILFRRLCRGNAPFFNSRFGNY